MDPAGILTDPEEMIAKMVEVIPMDRHPFRTILPKAIEDWCKDYEARQWTMEVDGEAVRAKAAHP